MRVCLYRGRKHFRVLTRRNNIRDSGVVKSVLVSTITKYCPKTKPTKTNQHSQHGTQTSKHDTNKNLPHQNEAH